MIEKQYRWKPRSVHSVDAETAGRALNDILARHGVLTPRLVVDESRPEDAPLHPEFEWDDAVAAELYREHQARYIIRSITVRMPDKEEPTYVRAFVSVVPALPTADVVSATVDDAIIPVDGSDAASTLSESDAEMASISDAATPVFIRTEDALRDPILRRQVLERALRELDDWRRRYAELEELARVFESVEAVRLQLELQPVA